MFILTEAIVTVLMPFAALFQRRTWCQAQVLLVGAILTPGQRTVAATLRARGPSGDRNYARYHHLLNRAGWSPLEASRMLLLLLLQYLDRSHGPLVFGVRSLTNRETLERRRGPKISALGVYRDAARSSRGYTVKASGLRCVSLALLARPQARGQGAPAQSRSRGGFSARVHLSVDALGNPLRFILTGGPEHDVAQAHDLIAGYASQYMIADKGYDAQGFRQSILEKGMTPIGSAPFQPEGTARI